MSAVSVAYLVPRGTATIEILVRVAGVFWEPGRGPATTRGSMPIAAGVAETYRVTPGTRLNFVGASTIVYLLVSS